MRQHLQSRRCCLLKMGSEGDIDDVFVPRIRLRSTLFGCLFVKTIEKSGQINELIIENGRILRFGRKISGKWSKIESPEVVLIILRIDENYLTLQGAGMSEFVVTNNEAEKRYETAVNGKVAYLEYIPAGQNIVALWDLMGLTEYMGSSKEMLVPIKIKPKPTKQTVDPFKTIRTSSNCF